MGAVSIFCSGTSIAKQIDELSLGTEDIASCVVELSLNTRSLVVLTVYHIGTVENFTTNLDVC